MDWHLILPGAEEIRDLDLTRAREVRLRPGQPVWALLPEGIWQGKHILSPREVFSAAQALSGHELAARQREMSQGFLPLPGGHRLGICGVTDGQNLRQITSLCVRLCHEVPGAGSGIFPEVLDKNVLILGAPGTGKTTLLRDLIRLLGLHGRQVGVADERGEIAACREGRPLLDVGPLCDVVTGMEKSSAVMLLIRAMAPDVIATDELGGAEDVKALQEARRCGVYVLATAHGKSQNEVFRRRGMAALNELFDVFVALSAPGAPPEVTVHPKEALPCAFSSP